MKNIVTGLVISVTALSSAIASASIASWITNPEPNMSNQEQVMDQQADSQNAINTQTGEATDDNKTNPQFTKPARIEFSQENKQPNGNASMVVNSDSRDEVPTADVATKHLSQVSKFINNPGVSSLNANDYLAVVLLNSALVQAGLDVKLNTNNQTTQNLFKNAVGCINSKKNESLNSIAKKLISDHSKVVDINQFIGSSPSIGGAFTAKCM